MRAAFIIVMLIITSFYIVGQDSVNLTGKIFSLTAIATKKSDRAQEKLKHSTEKYLHKMLKLELNLEKQLGKKDPVIAEQVFGNINKEYLDLRNMLSNPIAKIPGVYHGRIDSLKTALLFLEKNNIIKQSAALTALHTNFNNIQTTFNKLNHIQEQIKQRQRLIKEKIEKFGLARHMNKFGHRLSDYTTQAEEYKLLLQTPGKIESRVLDLVNKMPEFSQFFNKHSQLAGLFNLPGNNDISPDGAEDLQTRSMVLEELEQRTGSDAHDMLKQSMAGTQSYVDKARDKLNRLGNTGDDLEMPDLKPANQVTKPFLERLEYGINIQNGRGSFLLPVSTDISLSVGYRINSTSVLGIASCYRMGWGKDIHHLRITHEAIGFKTFYEMKLKASFWIRGGGEMNYRSGFKEINELRSYRLWQKAALIGISKKYRIGNKVNGNIQLLYDFLHSRQIPVTQQLLFRGGYTF